jgi:hypothetical protein
LLGCTARRAVLGIHRTQARRRGSSSGCGRRAEARRTTTTPPIDCVTSATGPGRSAAGRCRSCARPGAGPGEKPPPPLMATVAGPGAVPRRGTTQPRVGNPPPSPHPTAAASRGRCRPDRSPGGAQRATDSPHVADCRLPLGPSGGRIAGLDRHRRAGATRLDVSGGARARAGIASKRPPRTSFTVWARGLDATGTRPMSRARRAGQRSNSDHASGNYPRSPGREPSQSGRWWGTDGPAASASRRTRARGLGPGDWDYAFAGAAGRVPRTAGAGRRTFTWGVKVRDCDQLCSG